MRARLANAIVVALAGPARAQSGAVSLLVIDDATDAAGRSASPNDVAHRRGQCCAVTVLARRMGVKNVKK